MIEIRDLSFTYNRQPDGIKNINLSVEKGECILLCGRSGCGKTTLTRAINGLIPHFYDGEFEGDVSVAGASVPDTPLYELARLTGSVFQNPRTQFFNMDTDGEIIFSLENAALPGEEIRERLNQTAGELDIRNLLGRSLFELSGGEKQKIAFASAYAFSPEVFVLDEPSANLEPESIARLRDSLAMLKKKGKTVVIAEHRLYYLRDIADRIVYMEKGEINTIFSGKEFLSLPGDRLSEMGLRALDMENLSTSKKDPAPVLPDSCGLTVRGLSAGYGKKMIISDLDLDTRPGEIIGIIGHNGAGKSTLLRTLCGLHKKKEGEISWKGRVLKGRELLEPSYMVMQDVGYQLFAESVEKECIFGLKDPDTALAESTMKQLDLYELRKRHPNTLSGGQKQRAAVAVSMVCGKGILLFDEPTSGLDYDSMMRVRDLFLKLSEQEKLIFVVSHDFEFLLSACSRLIRLEHGKLNEDFPADSPAIKKLRDFFLSKNSIHI